MKMNLPEGTTLGPLAAACTTILDEIGEDPDREGLLKTPERFASSLLELTSGYRQDLKEIVNNALFSTQSSEMVVVKDIEFFSLCEHHILPFFGRAHLAYLPCGKLLGVSKLPRIVNMFARRLQLQERLTSEIVEAVGQVLAPRGVACLVECHHLCMMMRGVKSQHSCLTTTAFRGVFTDTPSLRSEFLQLIGKLPLSDNASGGIVP